MATKQQDFDSACASFTLIMEHVANWKHAFLGAAYSTRLRQAIADARIACDRMEAVLNAWRVPMLEQRVISMDLAHRIWSAHREIEVATKLIDEIEQALQRGGEPTPLDAFGRRRQFQLGVPNGDSGHRLFDVAAPLAREVIRAHIAAKQAELGVACHEAAIELTKVSTNA